MKEKSIDMVMGELERENIEYKLCNGERGYSFR